MSRLVGYMHDGGTYHPRCVPSDVNVDDYDTVGAIFDTDEYDLIAGVACDACLEYIVEPYYSKIDGSLNWPDWSTVECCAGCDNTDLPDDMSGNCPECGTPWWHTIADECSECRGYIHFDDTYYIGQCSEILCLSCGDKNTPL